MTKDLIRYVLIALSGVAATVSFLSVVLIGIAGMSFNDVVQKMNSQAGIYIFPTLILFEFCFLANDLLVYLSRKFDFGYGVGLSEVRFTYNMDNFDTPIPLATKLLQLYPLSIGLTTFILVLVLITR
ncbi:hypothetical protein PMI42_07067 [Bradyrhizobium sp. YR681]|nr:hypothetical protein PMI42_07067 [Bradyrhizobium sp. YR681]